MLAFLEHLDHQLFFALNQRLSTVGLDYLLWVVTWCADGFILVAIVGVMLWCVDRQTFYRHYRWLIVAVLAGSLAVQAIKYGVARPRPLNEFAPCSKPVPSTSMSLAPPCDTAPFPLDIRR